MKPDRILLDLDLPDINGMEAARAIRRSKKTSTSPSSPAAPPSASSTGKRPCAPAAAHYLLKPIYADDIKATIDKFIAPEQC